MAKIVDPDQLTQGSEVTITQGASGTIVLNPGVGNLDREDGVTGQAVYSFLKEEWKTDATLIKYPFPMVAITEEQFELINGWNWGNRTTARSIRDAGWALKNSAGISKQEWANVTTLGSFNDSAVDRGYYVNTTPVSSATPSGFFFVGEVNEPLQIYAVSDHEGGPIPTAKSGGGYDRRGTLIAYLREQQKTYGIYDLLTEQGISTLTYKKYAMPLSNASDTAKVDITDAGILADDASYKHITVAYFPEAPYVKTIGGTTYTFSVVINADGQSAEEVYEKIQYLLRQDFSINAYQVPESQIPVFLGSLNSSAAYPIRGDIAAELLGFVGDTLETKFVEGWGGTYIENFDGDDINRLKFADDTNPTTLIEYPFTATGSLLFNDNLVNDANANYWMFFTAIGVSAYGTDDAILVHDTDTRQISGAADSASIAYTFDYDQNDQPHGDPDSRTPQTNAAVTVVAIGLNTAQFVSTTATITRSTGNNISLVAALERNYST